MRQQRRELLQWKHACCTTYASVHTSLLHRRFSCMHLLTQLVCHSWPLCVRTCVGLLETGHVMPLPQPTALPLPHYQQENEAVGPKGANLNEE